MQQENKSKGSILVYLKIYQSGVTVVYFSDINPTLVPSERLFSDSNKFNPLQYLFAKYPNFIVYFIISKSQLSFKRKDK